MGDKLLNLPKNIEPYYYDEHAGIAIFNGDCLEIMPQLESVDLVLTDPPYGANWDCDYSSWIKKGPNAKGGVFDFKTVNGER